MKDKNKTLLKENTIRRFMKLAQLKPLTENFLDKHDPLEEEAEELDEMGLGGYQRDEEEPVEELPGEELPGEEFPGEEAEEGPVGEADVKDLVDAIADAITQSTGIEVSASSEGGELGEPEGEFPGEELPGEELPGEELPEEEPMMESDEELDERRKQRQRDRSVGAGSRAKEDVEAAESEEDVKAVKKGGGEKRKLEEDDEDLVAEITRRVAARLQNASKRDKIAEKLAERIFNKLSKKG